MLDSESHQWIDYNGSRQARGLPLLGKCCGFHDPPDAGLAAMTTTIDPDSLTKTHARATSVSDDGAFQLVWDFYLTHLTITVNRAVTPFALRYEGVPGCALDATDRLVLSTGEDLDANFAWSGDLPGPDEWAYLADPKIGQSLFLIRHGDDSLTETYRTANGDSAQFTFGSGQLTALPIRFSIGLVHSTAYDAVKARVHFVTSWIH